MQTINTIKKGSDRINGDLAVYSLRNSFVINNEIDWQKKCAVRNGRNDFWRSGTLTLNDTTDLYLSFNNAIVTISGARTNSTWITKVTVFDVYDFAYENIKDIDSVKTAIGGLAGSIAYFEQVPVYGVIKPYNISVEYLTER